jgi:polyferredoxin
MFMYIVGYEEVFRIITEGPLDHSLKFLGMIGFTTAFYFTFAWLREQVCTLVCPYGRLQGVLIDKQTINVYYDFKRGKTVQNGEIMKIEKRWKRRLYRLSSMCGGLPYRN